MNLRDLQNAKQAIYTLLELSDDYMKFLRRTGREAAHVGSQNEEDDVIGKLFAGQPAAAYVDVGACEPQELSNTWKLYQAGWRGLLIEPNSAALQGLSIGRPGDLIRGVASGKAMGRARLMVYAAASHLLTDKDMEGQPGLMVPVEPLSYTLSLYPEIRDRCRFCSIDVEGKEQDVLEGIDWATFHPDVFCVEHRTEYPGYLVEDSSKDWLPILEAHGYKLVWKTAHNTILSSGLGLPAVTG